MAGSQTSGKSVILRCCSFARPPIVLCLSASYCIHVDVDVEVKVKGYTTRTES